MHLLSLPCDVAKKEYKKLALKYHPNKGGNILKFQNLQNQYDRVKKRCEPTNAPQHKNAPRRANSPSPKRTSFWTFPPSPKRKQTPPPPPFKNFPHRAARDGFHPYRFRPTANLPRVPRPQQHPPRSSNPVFVNSVFLKLSKIQRPKYPPTLRKK